MYHALLNVRVRVAGGNGLTESLEVIHTDNENVFHATILQFVKDSEPKFRRFVLADPHAHHVFTAFQVNANDHARSLNVYSGFRLHFAVNRIQVYYGVHFLQRPALPFLDVR
jgi:hypothetical protein